MSARLDSLEKVLENALEAIRDAIADLESIDVEADQGILFGTKHKEDVPIIDFSPGESELDEDEDYRIKATVSISLDAGELKEIIRWAEKEIARVHTSGDITHLEISGTAYISTGSKEARQTLIMAARNSFTK